MTKDKKSTISVQGAAITILSHREEDYLSLTDMAKKFGDDSLIYSWMRNRNTLELLGIFEQIHNPDFKGGEFETFKKRGRAEQFPPDSQKMGRCHLGHLEKMGHVWN